MALEDVVRTAAQFDENENVRRFRKTLAAVFDDPAVKRLIRSMERSADHTDDGSGK